MNADAPETGSLTPESAVELRQALADRLDALDRAGAVRLALDAVDEGRTSIPDLYTQVLGPYLADVGSQWQHGRERVWQEHFASQVVRTIIEALYPEVARQAAQIPRRGDTVLLVCPPEEAHELGLRMLADRFELAGYRAIFLGADTPIDDIVDAAQAVHASIVALSVSTVIERVELRRFVDALKQRLDGVRIIVGGPALHHDPGAWEAEEMLDPAELGLPGSAPR